MIGTILLVLLCIKNAAHARRRGRKAAGFVWMTVGLWIGGAIVGLLLGAVCTYSLANDIAVLMITLGCMLLFEIGGGIGAYFITKNCKPGEAAPTAAETAAPAKNAPMPETAQAIPRTAAVQAAMPEPAGARAPGARFCMSCGQRLPDNAQFCQRCGTPVMEVRFARPEPAHSAAPESAANPAAMSAGGPAAPVFTYAAAPKESAQAAQRLQAAEPVPPDTPEPSAREAVPTASRAKPAAQTKPWLNRLKRAVESMGKRKRLFFLGGAALFLTLLVALICLLSHNARQTRYNEGVTALEEGNYAAAMAAFSELNSFDDSEEMHDYAYSMMHYALGTEQLQKGEYESAREHFKVTGDFLDAQELARRCGELAAGEAPIAGGCLPMPELDADGKDADGMKLPLPAEGESLYIGTMDFQQTELSKMAFILSADGGEIHDITIYHKNVAFRIKEANLAVQGLSTTESYQAAFRIDGANKITLGKTTLNELVIDGDHAEALLNYVYTHRISKTYDMPFGETWVRFARIAGSPAFPGEAADRVEETPATEDLSPNAENGPAEIAPISYGGKHYYISTGEIGLDDKGNRTIEIRAAGIGGTIPIRNGNMIVIIQAKMRAAGKTYGWDNVSVSQDAFTFTFNTGEMPEAIILYPYGEENDESTHAIYDFKRGAFAQLPKGY